MLNVVQRSEMRLKAALKDGAGIDAVRERIEDVLERAATERATIAPRGGLMGTQPRTTDERSLIAMVEEADPQVLHLMVEVLGELGGDDAARAIENKLLASRGWMDSRSRQAAIAALGRIGGHVAALTLAKLATSSAFADEERRHAFHSLEEIVGLGADEIVEGGVVAIDAEAVALWEDHRGRLQHWAPAAVIETLEKSEDGEWGRRANAVRGVIATRFRADMEAAVERPLEHRRRVLLVDETSEGSRLANLLREHGFETEISSPAAALLTLERARYDVILADLAMPDTSGFQLVHRLKQLAPNVPLVVISAGNASSAAIEARRIGAEDYINKPADWQSLLSTVEHAQTASRFPKSANEPATQTLWIGNSNVMRKLKRLASRAARTSVPVLISGEPGTGMEIAARAIHGRSARKAEEFLNVDCAALPGELLDAELFGLEKGAPGRVEQAKNGTLFLNEVDALSATLQAKLLELIEKHTFHRVGTTRARRAKPRVIAATHRDLEQMVSIGEFREALFERLSCTTLHLPPLRERDGDIVELAAYFLEQFGAQFGITGLHFEAEALELLAAYEWPGNVRELMNVVRNVVVVSHGGTIGADDIARALERSRGVWPSDVERQEILDALERLGSIRQRAARALGSLPPMLHDARGKEDFTKS